MIRFTAVTLVLGLALPALAQDIASGPDAKAAVPALKVYDATGANKEKEVDYAAERKDKPTVYLAIPRDKFTRPMNQFMKKLDEAVAKDFKDAYVVAVFITDNLDDTKAFLPKVQQSVQHQQTALTTVGGDKTGPKGWNINTDAHITVTIANKGKVVKNFGYNVVNDTDVANVTAELKKAIDAK